ncbi:P-loop containing nucleoside triphosphate hydrolase protein, partial [Amanita muscaria]
IVSGILRSNLNPFGLHDDRQLWDALKRSHLLDTFRSNIGKTLKEEQRSTNHFTLDTVIEDEGANLSIQRSLVSLARALVKDSKIIILDEATASVDYETDRKIQETIAREFQDHRLRTIISYGRICVLDAGQVAEFDTPERLYDKPNGIFRGMCQQSSITLNDIKQACKSRKSECEYASWNGGEIGLQRLKVLRHPQNI